MAGGRGAASADDDDNRFGFGTRIGIGVGRSVPQQPYNGTVTRDVLLVALVGLPAAAVLNAAYFGLELRRFLRDTPRIAGTHDLELLKVVVARQMYAALVQIVLLASPPVMFGIGLLQGLLVPSEALLVVLPAAAALLVGAAFKRTEAAVRSLPADDEHLASQRDTIVRTWLRKPVPGW